MSRVVRDPGRLSPLHPREVAHRRLDDRDALVAGHPGDGEGGGGQGGGVAGGGHQPRGLLHAPGGEGGGGGDLENGDGE